MQKTRTQLVDALAKWLSTKDPCREGRELAEGLTFEEAWRKAPKTYKQWASWKLGVPEAQHDGYALIRGDGCPGCVFKPTWAKVEKLAREAGLL